MSLRQSRHHHKFQICTHSRYSLRELKQLFGKYAQNQRGFHLALPWYPFFGAVCSFLSSVLASRDVTVESRDIRMSGFLAGNENGPLDEDIPFSDWIELWNSHPTQPVELGSLALTDDVTDPSKWTFPTTILGANDYIVFIGEGSQRVIVTTYKLQVEQRRGILRITG